MAGAPSVAADKTTHVPAMDTTAAPAAPVKALRKPRKELTTEQRAIKTEKRGLWRKRLKSKTEQGQTAASRPRRRQPPPRTQISSQRRPRLSSCVLSMNYVDPGLLFWILCRMPIWHIFCYHCLCLLICNYFEIYCLKKNRGQTKWVGPLGALARKGRTGTDHCPFPDPNGAKMDEKQVRLDRHVEDGLTKGQD